jgi:putative hydrolase of HD superfamily
MEFLLEVDRLKSVLRQTLLVDGSRRENSAEHSWHVALMAVVLGEHVAEGVDVARAVRMLLVHDIVEVEAGDTFLYDAQATRDKAAREAAAAERLFGLLPPEQGAELRGLWEEFEARRTAEARFARALDRLQPLVHNYETRGAAWRRHGVTAPEVLAANRIIADASPGLWAYARGLIEDAVARGFLAPGPDPGRPQNAGGEGSAAPGP